MEDDAGDVTDTSPSAALEIAQGRDITIYANPDPMPAMTAQEEDIADTLEDQNPDTVDDSDKDTIARACEKHVLAALRPASDCTSLPIFVVGHDARTPGENDLDGLARNPSWVALNRRVDSTNSQWYNLPTGIGRATPDPGCLQAQRKPVTAHCDEYPYWATMQAYNGTLNMGTPTETVPSIRWTPEVENAREGRVLQQFTSASGPGTFGSRGCDIEARSLTTRRQRSRRPIS